MAESDHCTLFPSPPETSKLLIRFLTQQLSQESGVELVSHDCVRSFCRSAQVERHPVVSKGHPRVTNSLEVISKTSSSQGLGILLDGVNGLAASLPSLIRALEAVAQVHPVLAGMNSEEERPGEREDRSAKLSPTVDASEDTTEEVAPDGPRKSLPLTSLTGKQDLVDHAPSEVEDLQRIHSNDMEVQSTPERPLTLDADGSGDSKPRPNPDLIPSTFSNEAAVTTSMEEGTAAYARPVCVKCASVVQLPCWVCVECPGAYQTRHALGDSLIKVR
ncbi:hypothetical protein NUW54_g12557 [Trametes sanguinea]|uniref:Uncharacterized protein n=1 Tax=Trametes sanguinea TaxID=158606 RepID=A0ACC1MWK0_9APHY|nr:hypothetical protein NUW54_g12557 [Trametes sanguinea]